MSIWNGMNDGTVAKETQEKDKIPRPIEEYISFKDTNHKNPYKNDYLLEAEDIFCYLLCYKRPFDKDIIDYLIEKRKKLHHFVCNYCYRLPENRKYQPMSDRPNVTIKRMDREASKKEGTAVTFEVYEKRYRECKGCRVLKLKQSINEEIKHTRSSPILRGCLKGRMHIRV